MLCASCKRIEGPHASHRATPIWKVSWESPETETIGLAACVVRMGGIVIYPTETLYGLGGDPFQESVVERIFCIKGRDYDKPLPLIAADRESALKAVSEWPSAAARLAEAFWPGPLTLILPSAAMIPARVHAFTGRIAIRVSSHHVAQALAAEVGGLLISTSANVSGQPAAGEADGIPPDLLSRVDGMLHAEGGSSGSGGLPTTIVDVSSPSPRLIRPGCVAWETILDHLH